jgi:hypothetical protein
MKKNIIWLASYPKSGNTWCRIFLANLLNKTDEPININRLDIGNIFSSRAIIEEQTGYDISEFSADECDELRCFAFEKLSEKTPNELFIKTHDAYIPMASGENMFPDKVTKGAIYFVRNPLDLTVSFANHLTKTPSETVKKICDPDFVLAASKNKFNPQIRQHLLAWSGHVKSWTEQKQFPVQTIRYEDMLANPTAEFRKILSFLELSYTETKFQLALEKSRFSELKKTEKSIGFKEKPLNCKSFFNIGKKGYFKKFLTKEEILYIKDYNKEMMKKMGYLDRKGDLTI